MGEIVATGKDWNSYYDNTINACSVSEWTDIVDIVAGYGYTAGLRKEGTVLRVGYVLRKEDPDMPEALSGVKVAEN